MKNYYDILGVNSSANAEELRKAYRKLSVKLHPDKNDGDPFFNELFKSVNEAYATLSSESSRLKYDKALYAFQNPQIKPIFSPRDVPSSSNDIKPPVQKNSVQEQSKSIWDEVAWWRNAKNFMWLINAIIPIVWFFTQGSNSNSMGAKESIVKDEHQNEAYSYVEEVRSIRNDATVQDDSVIYNDTLSRVSEESGIVPTEKIEDNIESVITAPSIRAEENQSDEVLFFHVGDTVKWQRNSRGKLRYGVIRQRLSKHVLLEVMDDKSGVRTEKVEYHELVRPD